MKVIPLLLAALILLVSGCNNGDAAVQLSVGETVLVPNDYALIDASAYGQAENDLTLYIQHKESGRIYEYRKGKIGREIILPEGYSLTAVSAYGKFENKVTFYCRKNGTEQTIICQPK